MTTLEKYSTKYPGIMHRDGDLFTVLERSTKIPLANYVEADMPKLQDFNIEFLLAQIGFECQFSKAESDIVHQKWGASAWPKIIDLQKIGLVKVPYEYDDKDSAGRALLDKVLEGPNTTQLALDLVR
jgi:hypothetical protein